MTKGGIHAFTRSLATHLIDRGIRVNAVAPGPVWTPLNPADKSAERIVKFGRDTPMKRPAQPEEIASLLIRYGRPMDNTIADFVPSVKITILVIYLTDNRYHAGLPFAVIGHTRG